MKKAEKALRISEAQMAGIISIAADAIISIDDEQRIILYNEGAEKIFGWPSDEVLGKPLDMLIPERFREAHRQQIRDFGAGPVHSRRMGERRPDIVGLRKNGVEFPADAAISKLNVEGVRIYTVVLRDITARKKAEREQTFLSELGEALATTLDYEEMLTKIAERSVRFFADCCIIDLIENEGDVPRWKVAHRDPSQNALVESLEHVVIDRKKPNLISTILDAKHTVLISEVTSEFIESISQTSTQQQVFHELHPASILGLPLITRGQIRGAVVMIRTSSDRPYVSEDVRFGDKLAYRVAHSIESAQLYRAAKSAIQARDEVLSIVAHDLRNPLHTARLAVTTLLINLSKVEDSGSMQNSVKTIERSIRRADRLIQDLLDAVRLESGRLVLERTPVPSTDLLAETLDTFVPMAANASLTLQAESLEPLPSVLADKERIHQVFSNLVGNAIKFTPMGGQIRIGGAPRGEEVCFWVKDTGYGIAPEDVPHLFDRFWKTRRIDKRGTGLGLPIAKGIVEAHGGRIWAESMTGRGSTFYFTLPTVSSVRKQLEDTAPASL